MFQLPRAHFIQFGKRLYSSNSILPQTSEVVVIGGGVVGASTAYHLAKRGLQVTLLERHKYLLIYPYYKDSCELVCSVRPPAFVSCPILNLSTCRDSLCVWGVWKNPKPRIGAQTKKFLA